MSLTDTRVELY